MFCPRFADKSPALQIEGAGKTGCAPHPRSRVRLRIAKAAHEHTGSAGASRPSLRKEVHWCKTLIQINYMRLLCRHLCRDPLTGPKAVHIWGARPSRPSLAPWVCTLPCRAPASQDAGAFNGWACPLTRDGQTAHHVAHCAFRTSLGGEEPRCRQSHCQRADNEAADCKCLQRVKHRSEVQVDNCLERIDAWHHDKYWGHDKSHAWHGETQLSNQCNDSDCQCGKKCCRSHQSAQATSNSIGPLLRSTRLSGLHPVRPDNATNLNELCPSFAHHAKIRFART
jgi:hypothetical protein